MLRTRIITALLLLPGVFLTVYWLSSDAFFAVFSVVAMLGAMEWANLAKLEHFIGKALYLLVLLGFCLLFWLNPDIYAQWHRQILWLGAGVWLFAMAVVGRYPSSQTWLRQAVILCLGWAVLACATIAAVEIRLQPEGGHWLMWLLILVWGADVGAYFAGRAWGDAKLAPKVSPGKTWAGFFGGLVTSCLVSGGILLAWGKPEMLWVIPILVIVSVFGDLFESVLKRHAGVKDSGTLLPGHGGVLDRIDSILAVLPFFALIVAVVGA